MKRAFQKNKREFRQILKGLDRSLCWEVERTWHYNGHRSYDYYLRLKATGKIGGEIMIAVGRTGNTDNVLKLQAKYERWASEIYKSLGLEWDAPTPVRYFQITGVVSQDEIKLEWESKTAWKRNEEIAVMGEYGERHLVEFDGLRESDFCVDIVWFNYHLNTQNLQAGQALVAKHMLKRMRQLQEKMDRYMQTMYMNKEKIEAYTKMPPNEGTLPRSQRELSIGFKNNNAKL